MNERIKELARQACFKHQDEESIQYFAELVVRECGIVADQWVNDEDNGQNLVSSKLKQHFGVGDV